MGRGASGSNPIAKQAEKYKKEAQAAAKAYSEKGRQTRMHWLRNINHKITRYGQKFRRQQP